MPATSRFCSSCGRALSSLSQAVTSPPENLPAFGGRVGRLVSSDSISVGGFTPGAILADRYRIIGLLGRGGMGEVYRADDLKLGQPVALKFLPRELSADPIRRERFFAEVRITRQLSHPNICRVYDIADINGQHFLTMEFIDGEDLESLIRRIGYLSNEKALDIARQVVAGLGAAHERGVLHRDLKPANIMLDGHGRVRITDFGLAIATTDEVPEGDVSGTPAYMAPEQLAGKGASVRSDIYALGLVLHEIACGKKVFTATSIAELRAEKERQIAPAPSDVRAGVDPVLDRLIVRCLERDPRARPASVAQVAAALPGGDPLAAAIAAGETPSPEMLIASGPTEGLRPALAAAFLAFVIVGSLAAAAVNDRVGLVQRVKLAKSPEALAERAREFLRRAGYEEAARDTAFGFYHDPDALRYFANAKTSARSSNHLNAFRAVGFFYRQSPVPLLSVSPLSGVDPGDPPLQTPGDVEVRLDGDGRLRAFEAVPPRVELIAPPSPPTDWSLLFAEARLDQHRWMLVQPQWNPSFFAETRTAWQESLPEAPGEPTRLEAAAYRGRPVSFEIIGPWTSASTASAFRSGAPIGWVEQAPAAFVAVGAIFVFGGLFFARRNLRLGRGDRRGATRLMLLVLATSSLAWIFVEHHVASVAEGLLFAVFVGSELPTDGLLWVSYVAVEPFVRRQWPQILVSWTRLLSGHWRDRLVGRDVLVGCTAGVATVCVTMLFYSLALWIGHAPLGLLTPDWNMLNGVGSFVGALFARVGDGVFGGLSSLLVLFLLRVALRRDWAAAVAYVLLRGVPWSIIVLGTSSWLVAPLGLLTGLLSYFVVMRVGLVAAILSSFVVYLLLLSPTTLHSSAWYAGIGYVTLAVAFAISAYGFRTSLGGRRLLAGVGVDE